MRTALALSIFVVLFLTLTVSSYRRESATWDEPQHLTAGYTILTHGDYRVDPEHPPLLRAWAALPLRAMKSIQPSPHPLPTETGTTWLMLEQFYYCHNFLYRNDADRLLYAGRFMIALSGVVLGVLLFGWARELLGFWIAVGVLGLYTLEPNLLAHARLVTTDFGVVCLAFGTVYFLWRWSRRPSAVNLVGLTVCFALAQASKFTAVLLGPVVLVLCLVRVAHSAPLGRLQSRPQKGIAAAGLITLLAVASYAAIWTAYGFRHAPGPAPASPVRMDREEWIQERVPALTRVIGWLDDQRLLPNAYGQGFLLGQAKAQQRAAFLAGKHSEDGWWYFFPCAILLKTPLSVLGLTAMGLVVLGRSWRKRWLDWLFLLVPIGVFLGFGMQAKLNIGLRHVLPIYPFVLLIAGAALRELWSGRRAIIAIAGVLLIAEWAWVQPHYLAFFNYTAAGPRHGHEYLVDSNLDWGQDLKGLKRWMDQHHVAHINLSYFGTAAPDYYGISCTHLPGAPVFYEDRVRRPLLPGYVAVSATNLEGVYLGRPMREFYAPFREREPVATIGYSIYVYWVDQPWW